MRHCATSGSRIIPLTHPFKNPFRAVPTFWCTNHLVLEWNNFRSGRRAKYHLLHRPNDPARSAFAVAAPKQTKPKFGDGFSAHLQIPSLAKKKADWNQSFRWLPRAHSACFKRMCSIFCTAAPYDTPETKFIAWYSEPHDTRALPGFAPAKIIWRDRSGQPSCWAGADVDLRSTLRDLYLFDWRGRRAARGRRTTARWLKIYRLQSGSRSFQQPNTSITSILALYDIR